MSDLPPDLPRLRTLETWLSMSLERVRYQIAALEEQQAEVDRRQPLPEAPAWLVERDLRGRPMLVHAGDCHMAGKHSRGVTEGQARQALVERVEACQHCRPETDLGMLD